MTRRPLSLRAFFLSMTLTLSFASMSAQDVRGDIDGDGVLTASDIHQLAGIVAGKIDPYGGYQYVDMGLDSGTLWATCNVGASTPDAYGDYYAWGETVEKDYYTWSTYLWGSSRTTLTRYCRDAAYGNVDGQSRLLPADDIARQYMGSHWQMPTWEQYDELNDRYNTIWAAETYNGVKGYRVYSRVNGESIFFPFSGYRSEEKLCNRTIDLFVWMSETYRLADDVAYGYFVGSSYRGWAYRDRSLGAAVRAVTQDYRTYCDLNGDGYVTISDVALLVQLVNEANDSSSDLPGSGDWWG